MPNKITNKNWCRYSKWLTFWTWPTTFCHRYNRWPTLKIWLLFDPYYFGHCSDELAACIPPPMARPRSTRQATFAHNYCVELSNARINWFSDGFFPSTSHLWNSLPSAVFPASFNLPSFKRQVYHHLRDQMAWFFSLLFLDILQFFSFSQGMQTRERAHCARSVFPFIKKKKKKTNIHDNDLKGSIITTQQQAVTELLVTTKGCRFSMFGK